MKTMKQLFRQPIKTIAGILVMTMAASILCICAGQALAVRSTKADLDSRFSTSAIPFVQENKEVLDQITVDQDIIDWLNLMAEEHPDIVHGAAPHGILSAVIPELQPYNREAEANADDPLHVEIFGYFPEGVNQTIFSYQAKLPTMSDYEGNSCYGSAMLVIDLQTVGPIQEPKDGYGNAIPSIPNRNDYETNEDHLIAFERWKVLLKHYDFQQKLEQTANRSQAHGYSVELVGTVTQVISLQEGLRRPLGMTAKLTLTLPTLEQIQSLDLTPGQQYIVYGMDYFDDYQFFTKYWKGTEYRHVEISPFDRNLLVEPTEEEKRRFWENQGSPIDAVMLYDDVPLEQWQLDMLNSVSMSICLPGNLIEYELVYGENGQVIDAIAPSQVSYIDSEGNTVTVSMEQYNSIYAVPTIAKLDGSVDDFLNSPTGEIWKRIIERDQMNNHGFAVVGVENMDYLPAFAVGKSRLCDGREFTTEEVKTGARVCVIHELVAEMSGLQLGDTVTLNFYGTDHGQPYAETRADNKGLMKPAASLFFDTTPVLETAEYTVVGFWRGTGHYYSFDTNTVFVPRSSVQTQMEYVNSIVFVSGMLENGTINQFRELANQHGYGGYFKYTDQNFDEIASNFHNYEDLSEQILLIGMSLYLILLMLFLLLYPASQRNICWTMQSMGSTWRRRFGHVLLYALLIILPATAFGGVIGASLWAYMVQILQATAESSMALQMPEGTMVRISIVQAIVFLLLSAAIAVGVSAPRGISRRR